MNTNKQTKTAQQLADETKQWQTLVLVSGRQLLGCHECSDKTIGMWYSSRADDVMGYVRQQTHQHIGTRMLEMNNLPNTAEPQDVQQHFINPKQHRHVNANGDTHA